MAVRIRHWGIWERESMMSNHQKQVTVGVDTWMGKKPWRTREWIWSDIPLSCPNCQDTPHPLVWYFVAIIVPSLILLICLALWLWRRWWVFIFNLSFLSILSLIPFGLLHHSSLSISIRTFPLSAQLTFLCKSNFFKVMVKYTWHKTYHISNFKHKV